MTAPGPGSTQQHWAVVSDTGGKAEVLGNSFVGPTDCSAYGGPTCIYPWFSSDGGAISYGVGSAGPLPVSRAIIATGRR